MKKLLILICILTLSLSACMEQMITISDPPPPPTNKKILIEEFTGVSCATCPTGAATIKDMQALYGENIVAVAIHTYATSSLGAPLEDSKYDFRTDYGDNILEYLGPISSIPAASINRTLFPDQPRLAIIPFTAWPEYVNSELEKQPEVAISTTANFNTDNRVLNVKGSIIPQKRVEGDIRIVGYLTESHIIDSQKNGSDIIENYEHNHVLREVLSWPGQDDPTIEGNPLATPMETGVPVDFEFKTYTLPEEDGTWVAENCHVIVFVLRFDAANDSKEVLQADEVALTR